MFRIEFFEILGLLVRMSVGALLTQDNAWKYAR